MSRFSPNLETTIEEGISIYEARSNQAINALGQKGFTVPEPPTYNSKAGPAPYRGELPKDITSLSDTQLGYYMGLLSEWCHYTQCQLAESDSQLLKAKIIMEHVEAKLRIAYQRDEEGKKRSNPERDDYMRADKRYIESQSSVIYWETMYRYIRAITSAADNSFSAVSRRITQRGQEIDRSNRTGSVSNGGPKNGPLFGRRG